MQAHKARNAALLATGLALFSASCAPLTNTITRKGEQGTEIALSSNSSYILSVAKNDKSLAPLLEKGLADSISSRLKPLEHVNPNFFANSLGAKDFISLSTPSAEELKGFSEADLVRVFYLLKALESPEFISQIEKELGNDTKDTTREHGGALALQRNGTVKLEMIKSDDPGNSSEVLEMGIPPDDLYFPSRPQLTKDVLFPFHFHASGEDGSQSATVSGLDFLWGNGEGAVFSRLGAGKFNVDVGLYAEKDGKRIPVNLDLGIYSAPLQVSQENPAQNLISSLVSEIKDSSYLLSVAKNDSSVSRLSPKELAGSLEARLSSLKHKTPLDKKKLAGCVIMIDKPKKGELSKFDYAELLRMHYILKALERPEFVKRIQEELALDTKDTSCEHGGLLCIDSAGKVSIEMVNASKFASILPFRYMPPPKEMRDFMYVPEKTDFPPDLLASFHFHAHEENHGESAMPSIPDFAGSPQVVFTRLGKNEFNVDLAIIGVRGKEGFLVSFDLGIYSSK